MVLKGGVCTDQIFVAVCDQEERYAMRLADALAEKLKDPYQIGTFTSVEAVEKFSQQNEIALLLVSEETYGKRRTDFALNEKTIILLLVEEGNGEMGLPWIDRYQPCDKIIAEVLRFMAEEGAFSCIQFNRKKRWTILGFYSPVKRCLQTSFALTLGQLLSEKHEALYIGFENFPVLSGFQRQNMESELSDLLYFYDCDQDKLKKKLPFLVGDLGGLKYLPPASAFFDTYDRSGEKWVSFLEFLQENTAYEYLLLDLSESVQGLLQLLEYCDRIYTVEKDDPLARGKLLQYECWMKEHAYADIVEKTMHFTFPTFRKMPSDLTYLTHSELADYARAVMREDLHG